jgi:hypothetical protein
MRWTGRSMRKKRATTIPMIFGRRIIERTITKKIISRRMITVVSFKEYSQAHESFAI